MQYNKSDPASIQNLFASISSRYDIGNALLSMQLHRWWNRKLVEHLLKNSSPKAYLDLCCGTGDIALSYVKKAKKPPQAAYLVDFCPEMLQEAAKKEKLCSTQFHYIQGDAQAIPLPDHSVDSITIAYGIRNILDPSRCISETFRVLKSGGYLGILELTRPNNSCMRFAHSLYLRSVVPLVGYLLTKDKEAYHYLQTSIHHFISADDLKKMIEKSGYADVEMRPLSGGIATIFSGFKRP